MSRPSLGRSGIVRARWIATHTCLPFRAKKKKKSKKAKKSKRRGDEADEAAGGAGGGDVGAVAGAGAGGGSAAAPLVQKRGTGRLITSGTVVQGQGTKFMSELRAGDAIIVMHPSSLKHESRMVKMVLSDVAMGLSSPFSSDLISGASFHYINRPRTTTSEDAEEARSAKRSKIADEEKLAFGTYAGTTADGSQVMTYRVKKAGAHGGYKVVTERVGGSGGMSREALLDARSKKKADRFCM